MKFLWKRGNRVQQLYSQFKILRHPETLDRLQAGKPVYPIFIELDPVAFCNHDCPFCTYRYTQDADLNANFSKKDMIPFPKLIEILDDCVEMGVKAIALSGGGEPSLHPEFPDILEAIQERGIEVGLVTNGAWRDKQFEAIVEQLQTATWVRFSLDAATPETHRIVHKARFGDFERARHAMLAVSQGDATVGVSYIVQRENMHEIEKVVDVAKENGAEYIRFGALVFERDVPESRNLSVPAELEVEISRRIKQIDSIDVYNLFTPRLSYDRYRPDEKCYMAEVTTMIGADARLYLCCVWKYRPDGMVADLNKVSLKAAWDDGSVEKTLKRLNISEKCVRCHLKPKNDTIRTIVETQAHANFI